MTLILYFLAEHQASLASVNGVSLFHDIDFSAVMSCPSVFFRYWLFASAFTTIYIIFDSLVHSAHGFMQLYYNWSECVAYTEDMLYIGPAVRSAAVAILALLFLRVQQVCLSVLWPRMWSPRP